jgi:mRNA interferase MazF
MGNPKPVRSEVWLIDFGIAAKVRPALVVSKPYGDEDRALIAVVPHTTSIRGSKYEIQVSILSIPFLNKRGLPTSGCCNCSATIFCEKAWNAIGFTDGIN